MKNKFIKITLTLVMLIVMAAPVQTLAAENNNNNLSNFYSQFMNQFGGFDNNQIQDRQTEETKQVTPSVTPTEADQTKSVTPSATPTNIGGYENQVADLVNKERAAVGLPALKVNINLAAVAEKKAEDLRDKNYFSHTSPTYGSPFDMMKQFGITYKSAGENIAKGQKSPESVMNGWMNSQGHKDNILNSSFTEIGVGYVTDSNGGTYWVQMFIRP